MDPLTQGLLGASCGQALYGRALGKSAIAWGALVGMAPDLDILVTPLAPMGEWLWHRGPTHALGFGLVAGPLLGWLLWTRKGGRLRDWIGLAGVALVTHPLLDIFTSYGTQLFWPFARTRVAFDSVAIVDPAYSLVLGIGITWGLRRGAGTWSARVAAWTALLVSSAYLALGLGVNARAETIARTQLAAAGVTDARISAYPTLLQLPLRRIVARRGDDVRVGWLSVLAPRPIAWQRFVSASGPLVDAARQTPEARLFEWFSNGQTTARVRPTPGGAIVELDDMRFGAAGPPQDGLWGVRVRLDAAGRPTGPGERFRRPLGVSAGATFGLLWRETFGTR
jgi:inner membrane protein